MELSIYNIVKISENFLNFKSFDKVKKKKKEGYSQRDLKREDDLCRR